MKVKALITLVMLIMLSSCKASEPQTPEETGEMPYGKWDFAFFTPKALPAVVTRAMIIDSGNVVSSYRTLDSTPGDPDTQGDGITGSGATLSSTKPVIPRYPCCFAGTLSSIKKPMKHRLFSSRRCARKC
jgi:hypothetical protein